MAVVSQPLHSWLRGWDPSAVIQQVSRADGSFSLNPSLLIGAAAVLFSSRGDGEGRSRAEPGCSVCCSNRKLQWDSVFEQHNSRLTQPVLVLPRSPCRHCIPLRASTPRLTRLCARQCAPPCSSQTQHILVLMSFSSMLA